MKSLLAPEIKAKEEIQKEVIHLISILEEQEFHHSNIGKDQMQNVTSVISLDMKLLNAKTNFS